MGGVWGGEGGEGDGCLLTHHFGHFAAPVSVEDGGVEEVEAGGGALFVHNHVPVFDGVVGLCGGGAGGWVGGWVGEWSGA